MELVKTSSNIFPTLIAAHFPYKLKKIVHSSHKCIEKEQTTMSRAVNDVAYSMSYEYPKYFTLFMMMYTYSHKWKVEIKIAVGNEMLVLKI